MNKHKHYDMIVAKAANMDLVVFIKCQSGWQTQVCNDDQLNFSEGHEYFLCLPQHKDACLHWLNGGDVQQSPLDIEQWVSSGSNKKWMSFSSFMSEKVRFRIEPKKEKRYLMANSMSGQCTNHFSTPERALDCIGGTDGRWQLIEIEVEV